MTDKTLVQTRNGWSKYRYTIGNATTLSISGNMGIDDIKLYPIDSEIIAYNYSQFREITSSTDSHEMTTYYEYDGFHRLKYIKDQNGQVIKSYDYQYKLQTN